MGQVTTKKVHTNLPDRERLTSARFNITEDIFELRKARGSADAGNTTKAQIRNEKTRLRQRQRTRRVKKL